MRDLYEIGTMEFKDLKKYIELPSFQRSVVWSIEKKEEFIDTVLKGSLLVLFYYIKVAHPLTY